MDGNKLGLKEPDSYPAFTATGPHEVRVRSMSKRHIKILNDIQTELGGVGRREAVAALCEYYATHPDKVLNEVEPTKFR